MKTISSLSLGFSPCPNDTFIFDALVHNRIKQSFTWNYKMLDVEQLNINAKESLYDVTKLSFSAYAHVSEHYQILMAGSALGSNCGPLIISKRKLSLTDLANCKVAIPGKYTTANLLMSIFVPNCLSKVELLFSEIEDAVINGEVDAGLIIHENRFTYQQKGLLKVADMGELWENSFSLPIPLGCIAVKRSLPHDQKLLISRLIKNSIEYGFLYPNDSQEFIAENAQDMNHKVQQQHIDLYVNKFSIDLGKIGMASIRRLYEKASEFDLIPKLHEPIFIND